MQRNTARIWRLATCLSLAGLAGNAHAGVIYGSISSGGRALSNYTFVVECGGQRHSVTTRENGSYSLSVPFQGECSVEVAIGTAKASATVFVSDKSSRYNFDVVRTGGSGVALRRL